MAKKAYEIEVNEETAVEDLHFIIDTVAHTSDINVLRNAGKARAEVARRERLEWQEKFNAESKERVNAQKFQKAQMDEQLEITREQAKSSRWAARAAWASVAVILIIAVLSGVRLYHNWTPPPITVQLGPAK